MRDRVLNNVLSNEQIAERLGRARHYLEFYGWRQGSLGDRGGPACVFGALEFSSTLKEEVDPMRSTNLGTLVRHLVAVGGFGCPCQGYSHPYCPERLVEWNDEDDRTAQHVIDLLAKGEKVALAGFDPDA